MLRSLVDTAEAQPETVVGPCPDTAITAADRPRLLIRGAVHAAVRDAQRRLNAFSASEAAVGRPPLPDTPMREDCIFGGATQRALIAFQQRAFPGQPEQHDGKLGGRTWAELDRVAAAGPGTPAAASPAAPAPAPAPAGLGCSDADIARALGIPINTTRDGLLGFDAEFAGANGTVFRDAVRDAAQQVGLDPGLLATNLLAEIQRRSTWISSAAVESQQVGVDYWHEERTRIRAAVPAARSISEAIVTDASGQPRHFINEQGNDTGPIYRFATGRDGMLALAAAVAWREVRLRAALHAGTYDRLPTAVRFAAVRLAFNAGFSRGKRVVDAAAQGNDPLIRSGPGGPGRPTRAATIRAGQAIHLTQTVFGHAVACP
jgi:hypothetical protein